MNKIEGLHILIDCTLENNSILVDYNVGLKFFNKIINTLKLNLLMPYILVDFPEYEKFNGITPFNQQKINNNNKFIQSNCFVDFFYSDKNLGGYSLMGIISESHISIHTFPEKNYFSFDLYSCKAFDTQLLINIFEQELKGCELKYNVINRGN